MGESVKYISSRFSKWLKKLSKNKAVVFTFLGLFIFFNALIFPFFISHYGLQGQVILDLSPGFSPEKAYNAIHSYGEEGRNGVLIITGVVDMLYPMVYSMLLILIIGRLHQYSNKFLAGLKQLHVLPLFILLFDFLENIGIISLFQIYPNRNDPLSLATSFFGVLKWSLVVFCIAIVLMLFYRYLVARIARKKN